MRFQEKIVLVTGSSSGIGRATALRFAEEGAHIVLNSKDNVIGGHEVGEIIRDMGRQAIYVQADLTNSSEVDLLFARIQKVFGTIDILVNNAGRVESQPFENTTQEHWLSVISTNLLSTVLCASRALTIMQANGGGKIINNASIRGLNHCGGTEIMAYSAAKAAVINFSQTLAKKVAPIISVNVIVPGFTHTPPYDHYSEDLKESFTESTALKRLITPDEIADAILYLAANNAITGQMLIVDAGFSLKYA